MAMAGKIHGTGGKLVAPYLCYGFSNTTNVFGVNTHINMPRAIKMLRTQAE